MENLLHNVYSPLFLDETRLNMLSNEKNLGPRDLGRFRSFNLPVADQALCMQGIDLAKVN